MTNTCVPNPYTNKQTPYEPSASFATAMPSPYAEKADPVSIKETPYEEASYCPVLLQENLRPVLQENRFTFTL